MGTVVINAAVLSSVSSAWAASSKGDNMRILYFSHSGNTRKVAEQIHGRAGGDMTA